MQRRMRLAGLAVIGAMVVSTALASAGGRVPDTGTFKIVALGDSLTSGQQLPRDQAYPALLQERLKDAGLPFTVANHGVSGDTTAGGLRRLDAALAGEPQILIVALGANDGLQGVPVDRVRQNLERIIETAQERGVAVLLCRMEALPVYGWQYTVDFHVMFDNLVAKYHVASVPFLLGNVLGNKELMSPDGIHPNAAGTRVVANSIWEALRPMAEAITH